MAKPTDRIMVAGETACAITGASGYIGKKISDYFLQNGWIVYKLKHTLGGSDSEGPFVLPLSLGEEVPEAIRSAFKRVAVLIHCAYDFRLTRAEDIWRVNVDGCLRLLESARNAGVETIIVFSTMSAFEGCKSLYGKAKVAIEEEALKARAFVIRPGLVFGKDPGGMMGALKRIVSASRIVPLMGDGNQVLYAAHEDDLCRLIFSIATGKVPNVAQPIVAASEKGETFRTILGVLASVLGRRVILLPLPWRLVWLALKIMELLRVRVGLRSDSVVSFANLDPRPSFELTKQVGIHFREFNSETVTS